MAKLFPIILLCISSVTSDTVSGQRGDGVQVVKIDETTRQFDLANKLDRQVVERDQLESLRAQEETDHSAAAQATDRYVSLFEKQFGTISAPIESEYIYKKHVEFMDSAETLYRQLGGATSSPHFDTFQRDVKARYTFEVKKNELRRQVADKAEQAARLEEDQRRLEKLRTQVETDFTAAERAKERYVSLNAIEFGTVWIPVDPDYLYRKHLEFTESAEAAYQQLGGDTSSAYFDTLRQDIKAIYASNVQQNELRAEINKADHKQASASAARRHGVDIPMLALGSILVFLFPV